MTIQSLEHDPPSTPQQRQRAIWLTFACAAPPTAWTLQLLALTALNNYACFPGDVPVEAPMQSWVHALSLTIDGLAVLIAIVSAVIAWRHLRQPTEPKDALGRLRLGRAHFVAMGGVLSGSGFLAAIVFETVASLMVPPCTG